MMKKLILVHRCKGVSRRPVIYRRVLYLSYVVLVFAILANSALNARPKVKGKQTGIVTSISMLGDEPTRPPVTSKPDSLSE